MSRGKIMFEIDEIFEDTIITKISIEEYIKKFEPEIQQIFYDSYGENLENIPKEGSGYWIVDMLESLLEFKNIKYQKVILMRFGFVTGTEKSCSFENGYHQVCAIIEQEKYRYLFQSAKASTDFEVFMKLVG